MDRLLPDGTPPHSRNGESRNKFTKDEDKMLIKLVKESSGHPNWRQISISMQTRTPRQCRERYQNYLSPSVNRSAWTKEEDNILINQYSIYGPKWNFIAKFIPGRTGNCARNRWQSIIRKESKEMQVKVSPPPNINPTDPKKEVTIKAEGEASSNGNLTVEQATEQIFKNIFSSENLFGEQQTDFFSPL